MPPQLPAALTRELGSPGLTATGGYLETWEETPELQWPNNVIVYDRMPKADAQVASVLRASSLPIRRNTWAVKGEDCREEVIAFVEDELGVNAQGQGRARRARQGIKWGDFLRHALLHLPL